MSKEIILTPVRTNNTESSSMISPNTQTLYAPRADIETPDEYGLISYSDLGDFTYTQEEIDNKDAETLGSAKEYADSQDVIVLASANEHSDNNLEIAKQYSDNNLETAKQYSDNNLEIAKSYSDNNLETAKQHSDNNLETAKNYTDNELLNYYTKTEVDNKDESVLNSAKNYTYSKEEIDTKDTALSVKIEAVEDKSDGRLKALSFEDNDQIIAWIDGTYTYVDGVTGETITPADVTIGQNIYNKNLVQNDYWVSKLPITSIDDLSILVTDKNVLNATDIKYNPANENKLSAVNVQGAIDEITTTYAEKNFVYEHAGYQTQVDFNAILENNVIKCTLDESVSDLELYTNTNYLIHIYLPLVTLTGELDDTYTFELQDKDGNLIKLNTIHQEDISETATVGDMCQIQEYDIGIGYSWTFNANYKIINDNGIISRYLVTDTIIREINTSMSGEELYNAINNSKLSPNTTVLCTSNYTNNGTTFVKGANYKIIGDYSSGELMLSWEELIPHVDLRLYATKTDVENKIENNSVLFTITTDKWQDLAGKEPYKFSVTIDCDSSIRTTGNAIYELINNNPVNFANYGFALINVDFGTSSTIYLTPKFTFYAIEKPTESVNLRVLITAKSVELIAQEGGAV